VDLVEIDRAVVEISREHLPLIGSAFDDPRARLHFQDGAEFVRSALGQYDVILVDSTEPMGPGEVLYDTRFFEDCRGALRAGGVYAAQALSAWVHEKEQKSLFSNLRKVWTQVSPYVASIPTYPGGLWTFALCLDGTKEVEAFDPHYAERISGDCRYYNPQIHRSSFCLPNFLQEKLRVPPPIRH
jgi:spermidine synthase